MTLHKVTWTDKAHPQTILRNRWTALRFSPSEDPTVIESDRIPVVGGYTDDTKGYTDFTLQVYWRLEAARPIALEFRYVRYLPDGSRDETAYHGPVWVHPTESYFALVLPTFFRTYADTPVGVDVRFRDGVSSLTVGNRILKAWERP